MFYRFYGLLESAATSLDLAIAEHLAEMASSQGDLDDEEFHKCVKSLKEARQCEAEAQELKEKADNLDEEIEVNVILSENYQIAEQLKEECASIRSKASQLVRQFNFLRNKI